MLKAFKDKLMRELKVQEHKFKFTGIQHFLIFTRFDKNRVEFPLPAFLSFLFLNTDTMTSRFPITSTTMVVIRTPASRVTTQGKD